MKIGRFGDHKIRKLEDQNIKTSEHQNIRTLAHQKIGRLEDLMSVRTCNIISTFEIIYIQKIW